MTIKDIARELSTSVSTVSRALQDSPLISKQLKEKIQAYARMHNYAPNALASSLRRSQPFNNALIAVVLPEFQHYIFSGILTAIEEYFSDRGYCIIAAHTGDTYEKEKKVMEELCKRQVTGIIISQARDTEDYTHISKAIDQGIPMVFVDRICTGVRTSRVVIDDYAAGYSATEHLIRTGCKKIAFLGTTMHLEISKNRYNGYRDAMHRHNLQICAEWVKLCDNRMQAEEMIPEMMSKSDRPDGVFTINDDTALGVLYTCKRMGLRVPEDVSICGFADGIRARSCEPQLTTIEQRGDEIGRQAAEVLFATIKGEVEPGHYLNRIVKTKLVVRGTTKPLT